MDCSVELLKEDEPGAPMTLMAQGLMVGYRVCHEFSWDYFYEDKTRS